MAFLNSMAQALERGFMRTSIMHTRAILLEQSDGSLAAAGISRELLERGERAWPWRADAPAAVSRADVADATGTAARDSAAQDLAETPLERARRQRLRRAAAELGRLDDRELACFGIARDDIERALSDATRTGRDGAAQRRDGREAA